MDIGGRGDRGFPGEKDIFVRSFIVSNTIQGSALDQLFNEARTCREWTERPVDEKKVRELYDLLKWGPTEADRIITEDGGWHDPKPVAANVKQVAK